MESSRRWRRRGIAVAAALTAAAGLAAGASGAVVSGGTLQTYKGGYRHVGTNTDLGFADGLAGAVMETASNTAFSSNLAPFPATDAAGATSLNIGNASSTTRYVREKTSPAGWLPITKLDWGGSTQDYVASATVPTSGNVTAQINGNDVRFVNQLANPTLPQTACGTGIKVLLLLDTSGSTSGFNDAYKAAANTFISSLAGTPTKLKISTFATNSSPGAITYDLATAQGKVDATARIGSIYPNNTSGSGFTNWDAALQDAATAGVDVVVMVTDGNPTVRVGATGSASSDYRNIAWGVASANLAKDPDKAAGGTHQTMMAVGVGTGLAVENLKAISGPTEGTDYTTAADPSALAAVLKQITQQICPTDLEITKTGTATVAPGGTISYDITVKNNGAVDVPYSSIQVTDPPPASLTPPANPPASLGSGKTLTWKATKVASPTQPCGSQVGNTATVALVNMPGYSDTVTGNNSSTFTTNVVCPVGLKIEKTGPATVDVGGNINYSLTVTNTGAFAIPFGDIVVTDPGVTPQPPADTSPLVPGASRVWTVSTKAPVDAASCGTQVQNTANVALGDTPGYTEPNTNDNTSTANTTVRCPVDLKIVKTGPATIGPGGALPYVLTVTNVGNYPVPFDDIVVDDVGLGVVPPADHGPLMPNESRVWTAMGHAPTGNAVSCGDMLLNIGTVTVGTKVGGYFEVNTANNQSQWQTQLVCPINLTIEKTGDATVQPGGTINYGIKITNAGDYPVPYVDILVADPELGALTEPTHGPVLMPLDSLVWTGSRDVKADESLCKTDAKNTATVGLSDIPGYNLAAGTHESTWTTHIVCPLAVGISKTATITSVAPGGVATYDIAVTNTGKFTIPFAAIQVTDNGATVNDPSNTDPLLAGDHRTWTATVPVSADQACGSKVDNTASVQIVEQALPKAVAAQAIAVDGQTASASIPVLCTTDLTIKKTGPATVNAGDTITYTITVTNNGPQAVPFGDIVVADEGATITAPDVTTPLGKDQSRDWTATKPAPATAKDCGTFVSNTASVALGDAPGYVDPNTDNNSSTFDGTRVICPIALTIEKTGDATVQPGGTIQYGVKVTNTGTYPVPYTDLTVLDQQQGVTLVPPADPPAALNPTESLTWTGSLQLPFDEALCNSTASNTATVALGDLAGYVLLDGTHQSTALTDIVCPLSVGITKTATVASVQPGGTGTYNVVVTNTGAFTVPYSAIKVTDLDPSVTLEAPANTGPLAPQDSRTWTATQPIPADVACGGEVSNTASVELVQAAIPAALKARATAVANAPVQSTATISVNCPVQVSVAKETGQANIEPGGTVNYTVGVTNTGAFAIPGGAITVNDPGATLGTPDTTGDLAPGATRTWPASKQVGADAATCGTQVTNTASVFLDGLPVGYTDTGAGDRASSASAVLVTGGICTPVTPEAAPPVAFRPASGVLDLVKTGPKSSLAGGKATFQITVTNTGASDLTGVVLTDPTPRTMALGATPSGATRTGRTVIWDIGTLAAGQSVTKALPVTLLRTVRGSTCNVATATADGTDPVRARACTKVVLARRPATPVTG